MQTSLEIFKSVLCIPIHHNFVCYGELKIEGRQFILTYLNFWPYVEQRFTAVVWQLHVEIEQNGNEMAHWSWPILDLL